MKEEESFQEVRIRIFNGKEETKYLCYKLKKTMINIYKIKNHNKKVIRQ